jgi:hypothetical protein
MILPLLSVLIGLDCNLFCKKDFRSPSETKGISRNSVCENRIFNYLGISARKFNKIFSWSINLLKIKIEFLKLLASLRMSLKGM